MNAKEFNKAIKSCVGKDHFIDTNKINELDKELKNDIVHFLVRNRVQIIVEFITDDIDMNWLYASGYLYKTKGKKYTFQHTSEQRIV